MHRHQVAPSGVKRRAALAMRRPKSLPAGTASRTEGQPVTWCTPVTAVRLFSYCRLKQVGRLHTGMFPRRRRVRQPTHCKVPGSPSLHGDSMFVSARNTAITSSVGRSLEGYISKAHQRSLFLCVRLVNGKRSCKLVSFFTFNLLSINFDAFVWKFAIKDIGHF